MQDLVSLGLTIRAASGSSKCERRIEIRLASSDSFVAWFQSNARMSDGELVVSTHTQIIRRNELNEQQLSAVRGWLREQVLAAV